MFFFEFEIMNKKFLIKSLIILVFFSCLFIDRSDAFFKKSKKNSTVLTLKSKNLKIPLLICLF